MNSEKRAMPGHTGFRYEIKMLGLTALRLVDTTQEFFLATNMKEKYGNLDDMVFAARDFNGNWSAWFIQIKHRHEKEITAADLRGDTANNKFALPTYFPSFQYIHTESLVHKKDPIIGQHIKQQNFVMFTNASVSETILSRHKLRLPLFFGTSKENNAIKFDIKKDRSLFEKIIDEELVELFAESFLFCPNQESEDFMDNHIEDEISRMFPSLSTNEVQLAREKWVKFSEVFSGYLTKPKAQSQLEAIVAEVQLGKKSSNYSVTFTPAFCAYWEKALKTDGKASIFLTTAASNTQLSMSLLKQIGLTTYPNRVLTLEDFSDKQQPLLDLLAKKWSTPLVIDCAVDVDPDCTEIFNEIREKHESLVLLVATRENETAQKIANIFQAQQKSFVCVLSHLTEESRKCLLGRKLLFQGHEADLATIVDSEAKLINAALLTQLLNKQLPEIGVKLPDEIQCYVPRVLTRRSEVSLGFFNLDTQSRFGFINADPVAFDNSRIVLLPDESYFDEYAERDERPFHMFEVRGANKNRTYHWRRSSKNIQEISGHLKASVCYEERDNILQIKEKPVVINGKPGMGKSTLLQHLAVATKKYCPNYWIITIPLTDYKAHFNNDNFNENSVYSMVTAAAGVDTKNSFQAEFFSYCWLSAKFIILLDGFEEIDPFTDNGLIMLDILCRSPIARLWITARPNICTRLESHLNVLSYAIKPFSKNDQVQLLKFLWNCPGKAQEKRIESILQSVASSFGEKFQHFTGVPLHTRMIADVYKPYLHAPETSLTKVNTLELFEQFLKLKHQAIVDKLKHTMPEYALKVLEDDRNEKLTSLALLALLPLHTCETLNPPVADVQGLKKFVGAGQERAGIVQSFSGETPQFIHRTFAEYFVAKYLTKHFRTNRTFLKSQQFLDSGFAFVRFLLDRILTRGMKLHEAVIARDLVAVKKLISYNSKLICEVDRGGRTALHIAAGTPKSAAIIKILLSAGVDPEREDSIFGWRAIHYAKACEFIENSELLIQQTANAEKSDTVPVTWTSLLSVIRNDLYKVFLNLLERGLTETVDLDNLCPQKWIGDTVNTNLTVLHLAAAYNATAILKYLLRRDTKLHLLEKTDENGLTPLLWAAKAGHTDSVQILLDAGAYLYKTTTTGKTLAVYAAANHNLDMLLLFLTDMRKNKVAPIKHLSETVVVLINDKSDWAFKTVTFLVATYPELITFHSPLNMTILSAACLAGNERVARKMLDLGADSRKMTPKGTILHLAAMADQIIIVKLLLERRFPVDVTDLNGATPLHTAASRGFPDIFFFLVNAGANLMTVTRHGDNLAHSAAKAAQTDICKFLIGKRINFLAMNNSLETALDLLRKKNAHGLVSLLEKSDADAPPRRSRIQASFAAFPDPKTKK